MFHCSTIQVSARDSEERVKVMKPTAVKPVQDLMFICKLSPSFAMATIKMNHVEI